MAPLKTEAIVLKSSNFRETSVILSVYTEHIGRIKGLLKGVRTEKSRIPPLTFTPGAHIFAIFYIKRFSELNLISSPSLLQFYETNGKSRYLSSLVAPAGGFVSTSILILIFRIVLLRSRKENCSTFPSESSLMKAFLTTASALLRS